MECERRSIASDLHDHLSQTLSVARLKLDALPAGAAEGPLSRALGELRGIVEQACREVSALGLRIGPTLLSEAELATELEALGQELSALHGLDLQIRDEGLPTPLAPGSRAILLRALRELLIDLATRTPAKSTRVEIRRVDARIEISVTTPLAHLPDEGVAPERMRELDFAGICERMVLIGGQAEILPDRAAKLRVRLSAPLQAGRARGAEGAGA